MKTKISFPKFQKVQDFGLMKTNRLIKNIRIIYIALNSHINEYKLYWKNFVLPVKIMPL